MIKLNSKSRKLILLQRNELLSNTQILLRKRFGRFLFTNFFVYFFQINNLDNSVQNLFEKEYETIKNFLPSNVSNILDIMNESLTQNDWLTSETKEKAVQKLSTFRSKIGHPEHWKDYSDFDITLGDSLYEISKKAKKWSLRVNFFEKINYPVRDNDLRKLNMDQTIFRKK